MNIGNDDLDPPTEPGAVVLPFTGAPDGAEKAAAATDRPEDAKTRRARFVREAKDRARAYAKERRAAQKATPAYQARLAQAKAARGAAYQKKKDADKARRVEAKAAAKDAARQARQDATSARDAELLGGLGVATDLQPTPRLRVIPGGRGRRRRDEVEPS